MQNKTQSSIKNSMAAESRILRIKQSAESKNQILFPEQSSSPHAQIKNIINDSQKKKSVTESIHNYEENQFLSDANEFFNEQKPQKSVDFWRQYELEYEEDDQFMPSKIRSSDLYLDNTVSKVYYQSEEHKKKPNQKIDRISIQDPKQQLLLMSKVQREEVRRSIKQLTKSIKYKVKQWSKEQKQIEIRKQKEVQKKRKKFQNDQKQQQKLKQQLHQKQREEKRSRIIQKMKEKQQIRNQRERYLKKFTSVRSMRENSSKISLPSLKRQQNSNRHLEKDLKPEFKVYFKNKEDIQLEEEKLVRRKKFNNKVRSIPIIISASNKINLEIKKDKSKNHLKYQLLNRRGLTDQEIYEKAKQFQVGTNSKEIGRKYLQEGNRKNRANILQIANAHEIQDNHFSLIIKEKY